MVSRSRNWSDAPFNSKVDVWSSGCVLHLLLSDDLEGPFDWIDQYTDVITEEPIDLPDHVNPELRALLKSLLEKDPEKRPTAKQALTTPVLQQTIKALAEQNPVKKDDANDQPERVDEKQEEQQKDDIDRLPKNMTCTEQLLSRNVIDKD